MTVQTFKSQKGFTLIELLVVIGILAVLLSITLIAINPARQFGQANDTKRSSDVNAILNAIGQYQSSNKGSLPTGLDATACPTATPCSISNLTAVTPKVDLCNTAGTGLVTTYIAALPQDPSFNNGAPITACTANTYDTHYQISVSATDNRVTVTSPDANTYGTGAISVTR